MEAWGVALVGFVAGAAAISTFFLVGPTQLKNGHRSVPSGTQLRVILGAVAFSAFVWVTTIAILAISEIPLTDPVNWGEAPIRNILIGTASFFAIPVGSITLANAYNRTTILQVQSDQSERRLEAELISEAVRLIAEKEIASKIGGILTLERLAKANPDIFPDIKQTLESFVRSETQGDLLAMDLLVERRKKLPLQPNRSEDDNSLASKIDEEIDTLASGNDAEPVQLAMRVLIRTFATRGDIEIDLGGVYLRSHYTFRNAISSIAINDSFVQWLTFEGVAGYVSLQELRHGARVQFLQSDAETVVISGNLSLLSFVGSQIEQLSFCPVQTKSFVWRDSAAIFSSGKQSVNAGEVQFHPVPKKLDPSFIQLDFAGRICFGPETMIEEAVEFLRQFTGVEHFSEFYPKIQAGEVVTSWPSLLKSYQELKS